MPKNSTALIKKLDFKFEDYKANERIGCWLYERAWLECLNHHGHMEARKNFQCAVRTP